MFLAILPAMLDPYPPRPPVKVDLQSIFQELNEKHFDGFLDCPQLSWNARLRTCAGRFTPGRTQLSPGEFGPKIEIAQYLTQLEKAEHLVLDVLGHEMIHYWLWVRRQPYGHTLEFYTKLEQMGVSRYNPVPQRSGRAYIYYCMSCQSQFPSKKYHPSLACASCCQKHSQGKFDIQFLLALKRAPWRGTSANV